MRFTYVALSQAQPLAEETVCGFQYPIILARALSEKAAFGRNVRRHEATLLNALALHGQ